MTTVREEPEDELLTVAETAALLKCKVTSIYTLTRKRAQLRHANPIPVVRLPCGLRFRKSSVLAWVITLEKHGSL